MRILLLSFLIFTSGALVKAQETAAPEPSTQIVRPSSDDELNKESSSYMGDPDPLDPLPVKNENLKEDEEPVLDDIRQVLDAPRKKSTPKAKRAPKKSSNSNSSSSTINSSSSSTTTSTSSSANSSKSSRSKKISKKPKRENIRKNLSDDEPDSRIETSYNQIYQRINSTPTSAEAWSAVTEGRRSEIYIVQKGDTLWSISQTLFGDPNFWPKIWAINRQGITNPHQILPGLKVYFYPGTSDDQPSLAVGEDGADSAPSDYTVPEEGIDEGKGEKIKLGNRPTAIPPSLPDYQNEAFFAKTPAVKVELEQLPKPDDQFSSNIILSDKTVTSELTISIDSISKVQCNEGAIVKDVKFKRLPQGPYTLIEYVHSVKTKLGSIYAYQVIGEATARADNKSILITKCDSVLSTDLILIQSSLLPQMKTQKNSDQVNASLLGGPDVNEQNLFTFHQLAYLDLGQQPAEVGQVLSIRSQVTESIHGEVKILEKFGSYAVGVITAINDTVSLGDTLVTNPAP